MYVQEGVPMEANQTPLPPSPPPDVAADEQPANAAPVGWDIKQLLLALVLSFVLQGIILPIYMDEGPARFYFALMIDGLVFVRFLVALLCKERGRGWVFYAWLLCTSPVWISVLFRFLAWR